MLRSISRFLSPLLIGAMALMSGCGLVTEDVEPCTMTYQLKFKYDYNILEADAFNRQVHSVNVWAFDSQGRLAWTGSEAGKALESPDYVMKAELAPGRYDFLAWCGFSTGDPFKLATYTPSSIEELKVTLATLGDGDGKLYVDSELPGLFHGLLEDVTLISSETEH
ncbi:FimB/Mfa2 family fimbrial subunit, partial [uncultured Muribaculum sp.]